MPKESTEPPRIARLFVLLFQKDVKDVFAGITFEVAYSLGKHVLAGHQERELPPLTPVLRWRKGQKIAVRNEVKPDFSQLRSFLKLGNNNNCLTLATSFIIIILYSGFYGQNTDGRFNIQMNQVILRF